MSRLERRFEPRRVEIITGAGGRRVWSADVKAAILDETLLPGAIVSVVARRHGVTPQQVFGWRREARRAFEAAQASASPMGFVPAVVARPTTEPSAAPVRRSRRSRRCNPANGIELEMSGVAVRVG